MLSELYYTVYIRSQWSVTAMALTGLAGVAFPAFYFWRAEKFSFPLLAAIPAWLIAFEHGVWTLSTQAFDGPMSDPRALFLMADVTLFLIAYGTLRAIKAAVEGLRSAFAEQATGAMKVKAVLVPAAAIGAMAVLFHACNAGPRSAARAHDRMRLGMNAAEAVGIIEDGRGDGLTIHSFTLKALEGAQAGECDKERPAFDKCVGGDPIKKFDCEKTYPQFGYPKGACTGIYYEPQEFVELLRTLPGGGRKYSVWQAQIRADYHGPLFQNNTFTVDFDEEGKVRSISEVKHWD